MAILPHTQISDLAKEYCKETPRVNTSDVALFSAESYLIFKDFSEHAYEVQNGVWAANLALAALAGKRNDSVNGLDISQLNSLRKAIENIDYIKMAKDFYEGEDSYELVKKFTAIRSKLNGPMDTDIMSYVLEKSMKPLVESLTGLLPWMCLIHLSRKSSALLCNGISLFLKIVAPVFFEMLEPFSWTIIPSGFGLLPIARYPPRLMCGCNG
jgi:hypothetical protein